MIESVGDVARTGRSVEAQARGIFAAIVLLVGAVAAGWFAVASSRYDSYELRTHDTVSGLIEDAPVEFHGVEVGRVASVELTGPASVRVVLHIRKGAPVSSATVATITSRGLASKGFTGYVYVALEDDGSPAKPMAAAPSAGYPQLRTAASRSLNMDTAMNQVNENVQSMTRLLQAALDARTLASMKESLDSVQKVARTLDANTERMNTILVNAERATARLGPLLEFEQPGRQSRAETSSCLGPPAFANLDRLSRDRRARPEQAAAGIAAFARTPARTAHAPSQTQVLPKNLRRRSPT